MCQHFCGVTLTPLLLCETTSGTWWKQPYTLVRFVRFRNHMLYLIPFGSGSFQAFIVNTYLPT